MNQPSKNMDRLKMQTKDQANLNFQKLAELFPNAVTETVDENGDIVRAIDKDILMQEISTQVVEGREERYQFTWPDKRKAILAANTPSTNTLRPCREESFGDFNTTENLYIEGDNLEVLKVLRETYFGKVKVIYIDPPYNTGNDFIYEDDYSQDAETYRDNSGQTDEEGNRMVPNMESNGRFHTDWLNMIYPRLKVAKDLMSEDGIIFISIGNTELCNLKKVCDEIFSPDNSCGLVSRVMKSGGAKGKFYSPNIEFLLVYAKNKDKANSFKEAISEDIINKLYTSIEVDGPRKGEKYRPFGLYQSSLESRANQRYYIKCPDGTLVIPPGKTLPLIAEDAEMVTPKHGDGCWRWSRERYLEELKNDNIVFKKSNGVLIDSNGNPAKWNIYSKIWLKDRLEEGATPVDLITKWENRYAAKELKEINIPFDFAKPSELIKYLISIVGNTEDSIILDFFSGSASTAHAVLKLNAEDNGKRHFIMVQIPEICDKKSAEYKAGFKNICEIGKERIRRVGKYLKDSETKKHEEEIESLKSQRSLIDNDFWCKPEELETKISDLETKQNIVEKFDSGFRVLKLDSTNMQKSWYTPNEYVAKDLFESTVNNIKPDRNEEDLLFQVMLELDCPLSSKIEEKLITGKKVFIVADGYISACFSDNITEDIITEIAKLKTNYFVMRDSSLANDSVAVNFEQIFNSYSPETILKIF